MSDVRILYCRCAYAKVVPEAVKDEVLDRLATSDVGFEAVADLCEMSARKDPSLARLVAEPSVRIAACFPRAVKWLFHAAGTSLPAAARVVNMRELTADQVMIDLFDEAPVRAEEEAP